jgi:hypothetical protein
MAMGLALAMALRWGRIAPSHHSKYAYSHFFFFFFFWYGRSEKERERGMGEERWEIERGREE